MHSRALGGVACFGVLLVADPTYGYSYQQLLTEPVFVERLEIDDVRELRRHLIQRTGWKHLRLKMRDTQGRQR